jgi:hypothetical protein
LLGSDGDHLVDQHVRSSRLANERLRGAGVAGKNDDAATKLDSIPERGAHGPMVDREGAHDQPVGGPIRFPLAHFSREKPNPFRGKVLVHITPHMDVEREGFREMFREGTNSSRADELEGPIPVEDPAREPEIRKPHDVVRVEVGEEHRIERPRQ